MSRSYYDLNVGTRVLIADDEAQLVALIQRFLDRVGYDPTACTTVESAWDRLQTEPGGFALAIVDMVMPGGGGRELAGRILSAWPGIRVIATSGYPTDVAALEALAPGRVAFLHKPFSPETLLATMRRLLA